MTEETTKASAPKDDPVLIQAVQDHESRIEALESQAQVHFEMIAKREVALDKEPMGRDQFLAHSDIKKGFDNKQLKWEKVLPRRNETITINRLAVPFYKGVAMEVPSNFALEMRRRDAARE